MFNIDLGLGFYVESGLCIVHIPQYVICHGVSTPMQYTVILTADSY